MKIENKRKALTASFVISIIAVSLFAFSMISPVSAEYVPPETVEWYTKDEAWDYAWNGIPDFDQKQKEEWTNPWEPYVGNYSWCGPTAVANSLWWWDSHVDGWYDEYGIPPNVSDHFPLVQNYGPWDDHDPRNVQPFIEHLAKLMQTDAKDCGTYVDDMQAGISEYLIEKGLNGSFEEWTWYCNYTWQEVFDEFYKCEDVIFLLGFYQEVEIEPGIYVWMRVGGHYVTLAGVGNDTAVPGGEPWVKVSDPCLDNAEAWGLGPPYVPTPHPYPHNATVHNNATLVSHDPYRLVPPPIEPPIPGVHFGLEYYPYEDLLYYGGFAANGPIDIPYDPLGGFVYTAVDYVVVFSPIQYDKPPYPEYAPSGVPDFDQHQDAWWNPVTGKWSYCGPVALANSLWYFDSKFDNGTEPDGFPLVQNYGPWDDHDPQNVMPLIQHLAWLADTDGYRTGILHNGTYVSDLQNATRWYFELKGLNDTFYERTWYCNFSFADVEYEVEQCQDVLLLLGFYEWRDSPEPGWYRLGGHYVTVSGVNASGEIKFSDPTLDNAEMGGRGQVLPPSGPAHPPGHNATLHNNASYVSHDYYTPTQGSPVPGTHWGIEDYPAYDVFYDVNGCNESEYYEGGPLFTAVEYAVVICPRPAAPPPDIAVTDKEVYVNPSLYPGISTPVSYLYPTWGVPVKVNVTVKNEGSQPESFNVTLFLQNATGNYTKGTQTVNNLGPGATTNVTFSFPVPTLPGYPSNRAAAWPYPTYTVCANATILPGETDTADNELCDGTITIVWPGDVCGAAPGTPPDGKVQLMDLITFAKAWFSNVQTNPANYNYVCDFEMDGQVVLIMDLIILAQNWFKGPNDP